MSLKRSILIPIRIYSEANLHEHWRKRHNRTKKVKDVVRLYCKWVINEKTIPCIITMTRISPRALDGDNLQFSMKAVRDQISDLLIPGKAKGQADSDPRIEWKYEQRKGKPKEYALEITIEVLGEQ